MTRTLIIGAGATGGALGARLISAGQDVTFLVRERRAAQLAADGLRFRAPDVDGMHTVRAVTALDHADPLDLVIVAVKAPALAAIIPTLAPAIGPQTCVVPLLNGMAHIDLLERAFPGRVLGGIVHPERSARASRRRRAAPKPSRGPSHEDQRLPGCCQSRPSSSTTTTTRAR